jgi:hypothetical protein
MGMTPMGFREMTIRMVTGTQMAMTEHRLEATMMVLPMRHLHPNAMSIRIAL